MSTLSDALERSGLLPTDPADCRRAMLWSTPHRGDATAAAERVLKAIQALLVRDSLNFPTNERHCLCGRCVYANDARAILSAVLEANPAAIAAEEAKAGGGGNG